MKTRICMAITMAVILVMLLPINVFAGSVTKSGATHNGANYSLSCTATLNAGQTYGSATTSAYAPGVGSSYYSLATTVTIHYINNYGHSASASGSGHGSAGASISSGYVTSANSIHDVISSLYGNWHAELSVLP